ncbi:DMT family transporter [Candidatus Saccharibacteria bacterium]|nr:DMT family transporter [Candidatus Saccharibacteria bacterium]
MLAAAVVLSQNIFGAFYALLSRRLAVILPRAQLQVSAVLYIISALITLPFVWYFGDVSVADLKQYWPYFLIAGGFTALNGAVALLIFRFMDAAMGTLLMTIHTVMAVVAAMYVLNERMGPQELLGAAITLGAVVYALSVHVGRRERRNWTLGILFTLLGAMLFSISVTTEKYLLGEVGIASYLAWGWAAQCLCALVLSFCFGARQYRKVFARQHVFLLWSAGLTRSLMGLFFALSIVTLKSLCIAVVLAGLRPLFVSFLGAWLLRERKFLHRKVIASITAAIGVAIMFW